MLNTDKVNFTYLFCCGRFDQSALKIGYIEKKGEVIDSRNDKSFSVTTRVAFNIMLQQLVNDLLNDNKVSLEAKKPNIGFLLKIEGLLEGETINVEFREIPDVVAYAKGKIRQTTLGRGFFDSEFALDTILQNYVLVRGPWGGF